MFPKRAAWWIGLVLGVLVAGCQREMERNAALIYTLR